MSDFVFGGATAFGMPASNGNLSIMISQHSLQSARSSSEALPNDEGHLDDLLAIANIMLWEGDAERHLLTRVSEPASRSLGYSFENWLEPDFWISHVHPEDRKYALVQLSNLRHKAGLHKFEYRMIASDGRIVRIQDLFRDPCEKTNLTTIRGFLIDVTEQRQLEETLRQVSGRLITAQEEEKKLLARELHDDLNQRMALISIELEQIGQAILTSQTDGLGEQVRRLQGKVEEISIGIHRMSYQLHPSKLDQLGLESAIRSFCRELSTSRGLPVNFREVGGPVVVARDVKLCIFRVAQEALQNAAKYSGAENVEVILKNSADAVKLVVTDDGCGFLMSPAKMTEGLGFTSIKERVRLVNGAIQITSKLKKGTRIEVTVPFGNHRDITQVPG